MDAKQLAIEAGYSEEQAEAIASMYAMRSETGAELILDYPAWHVGSYEAAVGGKFDVTDSDIDQMADAINRLYELGHPVALIDGHGSGIALGVMPAAMVDSDGVMRSALVASWSVANDIRAGVYGLSVEALKDYSSEAYTGGEVYAYWPTAWAVLPAGEQPAVPPGQPLAASEDNGPKTVRLYAHETAPTRGESPHGKEAEQMDTKELEAKLESLEAASLETAEKVSALETERDELKAKLEAAEKERDELKSAKEQAQLEAAEAETAKRAELILAASVPGTREKMQARLEAAEGTEAKRALLDAWEPLIDEKELDGARLRASESKPDNSDDAGSIDNILQAAEKIAAEKGIPIADAYGLVGKE